MTRASKSRRSSVAGLTPAQKEEIRLATERSVEYLRGHLNRIRELCAEMHPFDRLTLVGKSLKYFERLMSLGKGIMTPQFQHSYRRQAEIRVVARRIAIETGTDEELVFAHLRALMRYHLGSI